MTPATVAGASADDSALIDAARSGDRKAFEQIYRRHAGRVHALCLRLCRRQEEAEEMTQEVFMRAWRKPGSFSGRSRFSTWLHRLTVNHVLNHRRGQRRIEMHEVPTTAAPAPARTRTSGGLRLDLERCMAILLPRMRAVVLLHHVHGYRHADIADMLHMAEGTSKADLHHAHKILRKALST